MITEIIKQIKVKVEKDDKELIKKVIDFVNELTYIGDKYSCSCYDINGIYRDVNELENLIDFLKDLADTEIIELV